MHGKRHSKLLFWRFVGLLRRSYVHQALPEETIHSFCHDIMEGMMYVLCAPLVRCAFWPADGTGYRWGAGLFWVHHQLAMLVVVMDLLQSCWFPASQISTTWGGGGSQTTTTTAHPPLK